MDVPNGDPGILEWQVCLARRQPARAATVVGVALATAAWAFVLFHSLLPAVTAAGLLVAAVGEFLFPISYRLTPQGAEARNPFCWRRMSWVDVKQVYVEGEAVKLSPLASGGGQEAFRGVLLRCEANRETVLAAVQRYRDAAAAR
jgi:hypothetical protein